MTDISPRVSDAMEERDCFVSERDRPVDADMSLAIMEGVVDVDWVEEESVFSMASITFWFGGLAKSSWDRSFWLSDVDDDVDVDVDDDVNVGLNVGCELRRILRMEECCDGVNALDGMSRVAKAKIIFLMV